MIIHKNPISVETGSVVPEDMVGYEDVFVIDDRSDLAKKIRRHMPCFELVLDENDNLIDIEPTERPPAPPPEPTESEILTDYIVDVDFRLSMVELGL